MTRKKKKDKEWFVTGAIWEGKLDIGDTWGSPERAMREAKTDAAITTSENGTEITVYRLVPVRKGTKWSNAYVEWEDV